MCGVLSCAEASTARRCVSAVKLFFVRRWGRLIFIRYNDRRRLAFLTNSLLCRAQRVPPRSSPHPTEWRAWGAWNRNLHATKLTCNNAPSSELH